MIDRALRYHKLGIESKLSKDNHNVNKLSKESLGYKFKEGDQVKGTLLENAGELTLKMEDGTSVSAHTLKNMELGKLLKFVVVGLENGKLVLKPQSMDKPEINSIINKVIEDLNLNGDDNMKDIIHKLLSKHMTLDKEGLNTLHRAQKLYDLPTEVLVNLKESSTGVSMADIKNLSDLKDVKINNAINDLLKTIDSIDNTSDLKSLIGNLANNMDRGKFITVIMNLLNKNMGENTLSEMVDNPQGKSVFTDLEKLIGEYEKSGQEHSNTSSNDKVLNEIYKHVDSNKFLKQLAKSLSKAYLHIDMENMKKSCSEARNINTLHDKLEKIYSELESSIKKQHENSSDALKYMDSMNDINETLSAMKKCNVEGQYYCFPMLINEESRNGELYFFKPKKKSSQDENNIYIVLALDMPNLDKVEVHIANTKDNVNLSIKVKSEDVKAYLDDKKDELISILKDSGYGINDIEVNLLTDKKVIDVEEIKLHHLDIKA